LPQLARDATIMEASSRASALLVFFIFVSSLKIK